MFTRKNLILLLASVLFLTNCGLTYPGSTKVYTKALKKHSSYDAIIVPGVPFYGPSWDRVMLMRVIWAVHLYKRGYAKHIIMSGSAVYSPYVEAQIMKLYAIALGVPEKDILTEEKAEHSTENIWYGYKLARENGFQTVALASDFFQTKLLYRFAKKRTPGLEFLPTLVDTLPTISHEEPVIDYKALEIKNFVPLPERESKWQRLRGTRGKHINYRDRNW
jgi:uncharacterized SAM-binding protein YcdF (DUF218 family)